MNKFQTKQINKTPLNVMLKVNIPTRKKFQIIITLLKLDIT